MLNKKYEVLRINYFNKFLWLFSILALVVFHPANCFSNNVETSDSNQQIKSIDAPKLELDKIIYDFGNMKPNSSNEAVFNLKNTGNKPLIIKNVKKCCGAVVNLDKKELASGESGVLKVKYDAGPSSGVFKKTVSIITNESDIIETTLTITGKVIQTLKWEPESFAIASFEKDFNCPDIKLKSLDNNKFSVKYFASSSNCLSAKIDPNYSSEEIILKPKLIAEKLKELNTNSGSILIELNHPDYKQISLNFEVIPSLEAVPAQIVVFNADVNEPITKSFEVQDNENLNGSSISSQIESVASDNGTKVEMIGSSVVDKNCRLDFKVTPVKTKDSESLLKDQIVIKLKDGRTLKVPMRIFYKTEILTSKAD